MALFAVAIGDSINYQYFVYGSFVWEIHVRYDNYKLDNIIHPNYRIQVNDKHAHGKSINNMYMYLLDSPSYVISARLSQTKHLIMNKRPNQGNICI